MEHKLNLNEELNKNFFLINKKVGLTPLQALTAFQASRPDLTGVKLTYAGRLDPLASGLLPIVKSEYPLLKQEIIRQPKVYEANILFGVATDSLDILGKVINTKVVQPEMHEVELALQKLVGNFEYQLPKYSSYVISSGQERRVYMNLLSATLTSRGVISKQQILDKLKSIYSTVSGDFREAEVMQSWEQTSVQECTAFNFRLEVSSGTYIRTLSDHLGKLLTVPTTLFDLDRVKIGNFEAKDISF